MSSCIHCDQEVVTPFFSEESLLKNGPFCCQGCLTVFNIINLKGLNEYYEIKKNAAIYKKRAPVELRDNQYTFLDDADFLSEYTYKSLDELPTMEFYLEGIHCLACLWIIEKLPLYMPGVVSSKLNMARSVVVIVLEKNMSFSKIARELESIGYRPHPLKINQTSNDLKIKENRSMLLRIGVAAAASGNIMLYAISNYAGAGTGFEEAFNYLTVLFAIPVLTYSAYPFYKTSYLAIKNKNLSIDVPISIALIMGAIMGVYNLFIGIPENYFDSLTALVFLLLLSRYFLKNIQEKGLSTSDLHFFYQGENILKQVSPHSKTFTEIHPKFIKINDILKISPNQIIPADSTVVEGQSYLNNSLLTGESDLQKVAIGSPVYSGTMNISNELLIKVNKTSKESRLGQILKNVEDGWGQKAHIVDVTNLISKYFVAVVFILSVLLFFVQAHQGSVKLALEQALTLLIVTCPCALAIATPLTFIRALSKSAQKGIIIKDDLVLEKISKAKNIFIDKTGTLTQNNLQIKNFYLFKEAQTSINDIIYNLEKNSKHPIGKCLSKYVSSNKLNEFVVDDFKEIPGIGVSGIINNHYYEIKNYAIYENQVMVASFEATDSLRPDAEDVIQKLRDHQLNIKILSGDKKEIVQKLALELNLKPQEYEGDLSPENKSSLIKSSKHSIMIGDGANDSMALSSADTGIAVYGAMDISLRAADVYLSYPGLNSVVELITISKETMTVVYRNLVISLLYNSTSVIFAFTGHISPLVAAIIMPLSSLTVLISSLIGTKKLRQIWK